MTQRYPAPITAAMVTRIFNLTVAYSGGVQGDDVDTATATLAYASNGGAGGASEATTYSPKTQAEKAALPGTVPPNAVPSEPDFTFVEDITRPRGWLEPDDPYAAKPGAGLNPTITSLAPNTAVAGTPSPLTIIITGTNFTPWSVVKTAGIASPYAKYNSPTKITLLMDPARSVAGTVAVTVTDHSVTTAPSTFTYT